MHPKNKATRFYFEYILLETSENDFDFNLSTRSDAHKSGRPGGWAEGEINVGGLQRYIFEIRVGDLCFRMQFLFGWKDEI